MIKAYHATTPEAFESILEGGAILPASMRVDPEALRDLCNKEITDEHEHVYPREVIAALRDLVNEKANALQGRTSLWPTQDDPEEVHASCLEYISGGADFVYLQSREWESRVVEMFSGGQPWGFVFDAGNLLTSGALVFFSTLDAWLDNSLRDYHSKGGDAHEFVLKTIDDFFWNEVYSVKEASSWIRSSKLFVLPKYLGWGGPLPVSLAVEVWKEGHRMRELETMI